MTKSDILEQVNKSLDLYEKTKDPEHLADVSRRLEFEKEGL